MNGNVREFCNDGITFFPGELKTDPVGFLGSPQRISGGGQWLLRQYNNYTVG